MPDFHSKMAAIRQLRTERQECDEKHYTLKLQIHNLSTLSIRSQTNQTVFSTKAKEQVAELRKRIQELERDQIKFNQTLIRQQQIIDKAHLVDRTIETLEKRIERLTEAADRARKQFQELERSDGTKPAVIRKLREALENLEKNIEQDSAQLKDFQKTQKADQSAVKEAKSQKSRLLKEKGKNADSIDMTRSALAEASQPGFYPDVEKTLAELKRKEKILAAKLSDCNANLEKAVQVLYGQLHPKNLIENLDANIPFLLFPLRIETRFVGNELWLRIFPDDIAVHTHEKVLTKKEIQAGKDYWINLTVAGSEEGKKAAWLLLVELYGAFRAAWVARQTKPINFGEVEEPGALEFPEPEIVKQDSWTSAPKTGIMPDRFVIYLHSGKQVIERMTRFIPDVLHLGPDPLDSDNAFDTADDQKISFQGPFDWLENFDKAIEKGMGLKIPLEPNIANSGFDHIEVIGVYLTASEQDSKTMLEELIDNHHYGQDGFGLIPAGAPTNNSNHTASIFTDDGPDKDTGYFVEAGVPLFDPSRPGDEEMDGHRLSVALGIDYTPLQHVPFAAKKDFHEAVDMNTALYPSTVGYYCENLMDPVFSEQAHEEIRHFVTNRITGRGPFSAIRVGDQPYGVLLTSDFSKWKVADKKSFHGRFLNKMYAILSDFQREWKRAADDLFYFGKPGAEWDDVLMNILGLHPGSVAFYQRVGYSTEYLKNLENFQWGKNYFSDYLENIFDQLSNMDFFRSFGYVPDPSKSWSEQTPQVIKIIYQHYHLLLDATNLIDANPLSESKKVTSYDAGTQNYIHWLKTQNSVDNIEKQDFGEDADKPNSLLYLIMRQALLLQLHKASVKWMHLYEIPVPRATQIDNFLNIRPQGDLTKWEVMKADIGVINPDFESGITVADNILNFAFNHVQSTHLHNMRGALGRLAELPTARLERLLTEHIDFCSYRLDAWQTAMYYDRFWGQRTGRGEGRKTGIYLGAYGLLEDVRPVSSRTELSPNQLPDELRPKEGPIFRDAKNGGFVHAPSIQQATAAALLRSGYLSHANTDTAELLSVNLSSRRIRKSLFLLEGLRAGIRLEMLLGYQFERGLHDRSSASESINLDQYILDFREKFTIPQHVIPQKGSSAAPEESELALQVVNGLKLAETKTEFPYGVGEISEISPQERQAIIDEKGKLADSLDALKDILTAESVFQLTNGNFERAGAILNSLKDGHIPPDLEILKTPRSSRFTFTNRMTLHFEVLDPLDPASNPWTSAMTPRAVAQPGLNKWVADQLGAPNNIVYSVSQLVENESGDKVEVHGVKRSVTDLGLQPLDLIYIIGNEIHTGASELENRIATQYRQTMGLDEKSEIKIVFDTDKATASEKTFAALVPLLRYLKEMIINSRAIHAEDFIGISKKDAIETDNPKGYDIIESEARVSLLFSIWGTNLTQLGAIILAADVNGTSVTSITTLQAALQAENLGLESVEVELSDSDIDLLRSTLSSFALFGHPEAYPVSGIGSRRESKQVLLNQGLNFFKKAGPIYSVAQDKLNSVSSESESDKKMNLITEAIHLLLGEVFVFLPSFNYSNGPDLILSHNDEDQLLAFSKSKGKSLPVEEWIQSVSHVRPKIMNLELVRTLIEADQGTFLDFSPVQIPYRSKDSWLAVEFPDTDEVTGEPFQITHDTLSLLLHGASSFAIEKTQCGILIDDWSEVIPSNEEITGIAFNYDQPNSTPPQTLFLVIPPEEREHWKWDDLLGAMADTFKRAKERAVEPAMIDESRLNVLLPALISEFTTHNLNISLDYALVVGEIMKYLSANLIERFSQSGDNQ